MTTTYVQRCVKCWQPWNGFAGSTCNQCKILEEQERHHKKLESLSAQAAKQQSSWQDRQSAKINQNFDDDDQVETPWEQKPEWERDYVRRVAKRIREEELFEERRVAQAHKLGLDPESEEAIYDMHVPRTPKEFFQETDWGLVFAWCWHIGLIVGILWFVYG